jgi:hypothetical protein
MNYRLTPISIVFTALTVSVFVDEPGDLDDKNQKQIIPDV